MHKLNWIFTLALFFMLLTAARSYAQRSNGLIVEGTVSVEKGSVDGAVIQIIQDDRRSNDYGIGPNGQYKLELNYNHEFTLIFSREDNFSQKIVVDTKVPQQVLQADPIFPPFQVPVKLFTEISGIDHTFSENIVLKIYYSHQVDNFIADVYYNDAQIKNLIDQAIIQSRILDKEADYLAGLTKAELAELRKEYNQLIQEAENEYKNEDFLKALDGYQAAGKIFPKEQYPKDRIAEINDLLGLLMVAGEMQKALAERLASLISQADQLFTREQYPQARNAYNRALSIDPENQHAQQRVAEIAALLDQQLQLDAYQNLITSADNAFSELLYTRAQNDYQQALQLKDDPYPKQKLEEIDKILTGQKLNAEKLKNYEEAIRLAEQHAENQLFEQAIASYENALQQKPGDESATSRIAELRQQMSQIAIRAAYDQLIHAADSSFQLEQYAAASADYEKAADLIPEEAYPRTQLTRIGEILETTRLAAEAEAAEQARLAAEAAEQARILAEAEAKATEEARIAAEAQAAEQARLAAEAEAAEQARLAAEAAEQARILAEVEAKAAEELERRKALIEQQQQEKSIRQEMSEAALNQLYEDYVAIADEYFDKQQYNASRAWYYKAWDVKPSENYPPQRIQEINQLVNSMLSSQSDRDYQQFINQADSTFRANQLAVSRGWYNRAITVKPAESYPREQLQAIANLIAERIAGQSGEQFNNHMQQAAEAHEKGDLNVARFWYNKALELRPNDEQAREGLTKIEKALK